MSDKSLIICRLHDFCSADWPISLSLHYVSTLTER